jgi:DNA primase
VRQLYRDEWLRKFDALVRPQQQARSLYPRREWKKGKDGKFAPSSAPTLESTRAVARTGVEAPLAKALLNGFTLYPDALHDHVEELAHLPIADRRCAGYRDRLVEIAMSGQSLDREALATILAGVAAGVDVRRDSMAFSFTRKNSDPDLARRDLGLAVETLVAKAEIEAALDEATERLKQEFTETAFAEQQRLIAAKASYNDRLASLAGNE